MIESQNTDRTEEDIKQFYKSLAITLRRFCIHIKNFDMTAEYKNVINSQNVRNAVNVKNMMIRLFKAYSNKLPRADTALNNNLAYVIGNGDFKMPVKEFTNKYEANFRMILIGMNVD